MCACMRACEYVHYEYVHYVALLLYRGPISNVEFLPNSAQVSVSPDHRTLIWNIGQFLLLDYHVYLCFIRLCQWFGYKRL